MRVFHVKPDSKGRAWEYRWVLYADFNQRRGFVPQPWLDPGMADGVEVDPWGQALVAVDELGIAGVLRYNRQPDAADELVAGGTWVRPDWRKRGLAYTLWKRALRGTHWVSVTTVSRGGKALIKKLRAEYPKVGWNHVH